MLERLAAHPDGRTREDRARWTLRTAAPAAVPRGLVAWAAPGMDAEARRHDGATPAWLEALWPLASAAASRVAPEAAEAPPALTRAPTATLAALDAEMAAEHAALDVLAARSKLLELVDDRVSSLQPVDDDAARGPCCGYDTRLSWDDEELWAWASSEPGRAMLAERRALDDSVDGTEVACRVLKRKCKRHNDWSAIHGAELEILRDAHTSHLSTLSERARALRAAAT